MFQLAFAALIAVALGWVYYLGYSNGIEKTEGRLLPVIAAKEAQLQAGRDYSSRVESEQKEQARLSAVLTTRLLEVNRDKSKAREALLAGHTVGIRRDDLRVLNTRGTNSLQPADTRTVASEPTGRPAGPPAADIDPAPVIAKNDAEIVAIDVLGLNAWRELYEACKVKFTQVRKLYNDARESQLRNLPKS